MVDRDEINEGVEAPKQLAKRVGITERQVRYPLQRGDLDHVMIGSRIHIPDGAFRRFLASRMETPKQLAQPVGITDGQIYLIGAN